MLNMKSLVSYREMEDELGEERVYILLQFNERNRIAWFLMGNWKLRAFFEGRRKGNTSPM
jgi:hypothetical protein